MNNMQKHTNDHAVLIGKLSFNGYSLKYWRRLYRTPNTQFKASA